MTPDSLGGANALEELAGWISGRMDEAQAEAAYSPSWTMTAACICRAASTR